MKCSCAPLVLLLLQCFASALFLPTASCETQRTCCVPGEACWPSPAEFSALSQALDPSANRTLWWEGDGTPRVSAVPLVSEGEQPLYGAGVDMLPLYVREKDNCVGEGNFFCELSVRNAPYEENVSDRFPLVTVWPLSSEHVSSIVRFAAAHHMCVCVAGTGHDFLNRHSCNGTGMFIRTALMKRMEFDAQRKVVRLGPGLTFSEIHEAAAARGFFVSSGWASTVGIVGWSIGGGHGPFAPSAGLGVDNVVELEVVLASGEAVTANEHNEHAALFWAMRGGGGSAWGVVTSIAVRLHAIPAGGFTEAQALWAGSMCGPGLSRLHGLLDAHLEWALSLSERWGGLTWLWPTESKHAGGCDTWTLFSDYAFAGPEDDPEFKVRWGEKVSQQKPLFQNVTAYDTWWQRVQFQALEPIMSFGWLSPSDTYMGGVPSVAVSREHVQNGSMSSTMKHFMSNGTRWGRYELYQCITGNVGSPQPDGTSISGGLRDGIFHFVFGGGGVDTAAQFYTLGHNSYFSESAFEMSGWQQRLWGENYDRLLAVKKQYDPANFFYCRHCVGSE